MIKHRTSCLSIVWNELKMLFETKYFFFCIMLKALPCFSSFFLSPLCFFQYEFLFFCFYLESLFIAVVLTEQKPKLLFYVLLCGSEHKYMQNFKLYLNFRIKYFTVFEKVTEISFVHTYSQFHSLKRITRDNCC